MERVVYKATLHDPQAAARDLAYWRSRPLAERIAAVETLRVRAYGELPRLKRVARVFAAHSVEYLIVSSRDNERQSAG